MLPLFLLGACAGRDIHRDLREDSSILVRQWTLGTRKGGEAGDRGFEFSNPLLHGNTLVFGSSTQGFVSMYPLLQQIRWVLPIEGGVVSEISRHEDRIFGVGGDGFLYAVHADTGEVVWRYELRNITASRPVFHEGRLLLTTSDDTVYAFDAGTGKWLWHFRRRNNATSTIRGASAPLVVGNDVMAGLSDGFLVALNLSDGQLKWEKKIHNGSKFTDVDASPVLDGDTLYVPSYDGALYALKRKDGEILWRFDAGGNRDVRVERDRLLLASSDGTIYALQKSNAKELWKFVLDGGVPTGIVEESGRLYVGSSQQFLYVLDPASGRGLYRFNAGVDSGFSSDLLLDAKNQRLYAFSGGGNLYSFLVRPERTEKRKPWAIDPYAFDASL